MNPIVFCPAPGWPPPPSGWLPQAGWMPDPAWPPAPAGWVFYRLPSGQPIAPPTGLWTPPSAPIPVPPAPAFPPAGTYAAPPSAPAPQDAPFDPYAARAAGQTVPTDTYAGPQYAPMGMQYAPVMPTAPVRRRHRPGVVIGVIVLVIALIAVGIGAWNQHRAQPLTQAQFLNLVNVQLPADSSIPQFQFERNVAMTDIQQCPAYQALDASALVSGAASTGALGGAGMYVLNFTTTDDALAAANATQTCDSQTGFAPQQSTGTSGDVQTWTLTETDPSDASSHVVNLALVNNILVYAYDAQPDEWNSFVSTTFPNAVQAARQAG
ncbi:MAG: hypothetical protein FWF75_07560 [Propionibacteriaceae bacterium]|nr:hypothetical protein [Propionibacteriaceae bacterium]